MELIIGSLVLKLSYLNYYVLPKELKNDSEIQKMFIEGEMAYGLSEDQMKQYVEIQTRG